MQPKLSTEEIALSLVVAESIAALEQSEGWQHFVKAAEHLIKQKTPNVDSFTTEEATQIASKMAFVSGLRACLDLVKNSKKRAADLKAMQVKQQ